MNATVNPPQAESITLYYREGSSDKAYQCSIEPSGALFVVNFVYGRRGSTMQTGTKTLTPVDYETAKGIFNKLVREKMAKGYTPGADGTPYKQTRDEGRATEIRPQLLNPIEEDEVARLIKDPAWCMQEKKDGKRLLLQKQGAAIHGINKKGLLVGRLCGFGTVTVTTVGGTRFPLSFIGSPQGFHSTLQKAVLNAKNSH
jgi:bifunctional non-homologous end joining protein LigD